MAFTGRHSDDARAKMRAARLGKTHNRAVRAKIGASRIGNPRPSDVRAKISAGRIGHWCPADRLDDYRMFRKKRFTPAEARAMIEGGE